MSSTTSRLALLSSRRSTDPTKYGRGSESRSKIVKSSQNILKELYSLASKYEVGIVTWETVSSSHTYHYSLTQNHVSFYPSMEEGSPMTKGECDPMDTRIPTLRIPISQNPGLENGLENLERHVFTKGGVLSQEIGSY